MRGFFGSLVSLGVLLCVGALIAGAGGVFWYPLDAFSAFRGHLVLALLVLGLLGALAGVRRMAIGAVAAAAVGLVFLGPVWRLPERTPEGACLGPTIRVATANLLIGNTRFAEMETALLAIDADVLITQEPSAAFVDAAVALRALYPHRVLQLRERWARYGVILWSKRPLIDPNEGRMNDDQPMYARGAVDFGDGRPVGVLGVHLGLPLLSRQGRQMAALDDLVAPLPARRIVLGDFNAAPWSYGVRLAEQLTDTEILGGLRRTWFGAYPAPWGLPRIHAPIGNQIDHILVSDNWIVGGVFAFEIPGSDHRGVAADLRIDLPC